MQRILIIEDDRSIAELEKDYLEMSGFAVVCAYDGTEGERLLQTEDFDLVLLDLMLPGKDGFTILRGIAEDKTIPVLVVSAKDEELYKIKGLNLGADDYITKPFGMGELVARVKSHLKVYEKLSGLAGRQKNQRINVRGLSIDKQDRRVFVHEQEVTLKQKEFDLLLFLAENPNRVYDKETLFERVWGYDALSDASTVTVHIARIRDKIESESDGNQYIETVWGAGYRFRV
ncbi:MAG: response regulator transcription factor [Clostridia bacterium]